jgi:activator of 2-hydroxyglutaryl-CoA dehydratase
VPSRPRAVVSSPIARLDKEFNLEETIDTGVSGSGRGVVPGELARTECSSSLAIGSGLLHLFPDARTIIRIDGQSTVAIKLESDLRNR